jgi:hypothetical protein
MTPGFNDHGSHEDASKEREPLIDINTESAPDGEPVLQTMGRRRRLSEVQNPPDDSVPQAKPQRRSLSQTGQMTCEEPAPEPLPTCAQPGLIDIRSDTAVLPPSQTRSQTPTNGGTIESPALMDPASGTQRIGGLRNRRSLWTAAAGGLPAAVVGALAWAVITAIIDVPITWMAIAVGLLIAGAVRLFGRGLDRSFGCLGAGLSLFACILGNCLANCTLIAQDIGLSVTSVLAQISPGAVPRLIVATFHPIDLLFYGLALYLAYFCSFRRLPQT